METMRCLHDNTLRGYQEDREDSSTLWKRLPKCLEMLVVGLGGFGVISVTRRIREVVAPFYSDVITSEDRGVAQRRAGTVATLRAGSGLRTPTLVVPRVDCLIGLEPLEALRFAGHLDQGSLCLLSDVRVETICGGARRYAYAATSEIVDTIEAQGARCLLLPIAAWQRQHKMAAVSAATVMLGAFCAAYGIDRQAALARQPAGEALVGFRRAVEMGYCYVSDMFAGLEPARQYRPQYERWPEAEHVVRAP